MCDSHYTRRDVLSAGIAGTGYALLAAGAPVFGRSEQADSGGMPQRRFGRHDEKVSLLSVGGHHIGRMDRTESIRLMREAVDNGATFMDNAWCYHRGESELRMGEGLSGGYRDKAFLMTKVHGRDKKTAMKQLEESLKRLKTDRIDLWQYHEVVYDKDPDMIFAPGGAIEAADLAKKQGKVRYIGFTGHKSPLLHLKMLAYEYPWDAAQLPLNPFDATFSSFEEWVLPVMVKRGIAVIAMKTRGGGSILKTGAATAEELWRYAAALPVATIVSGMESMELLRDNLRMARTLKPMPAEEMAALREKVTDLAQTGKHEGYKTTINFDGWAGREIHGVSS
jgi:uncharacterized protein